MHKLIKIHLNNQLNKKSGLMGPQLAEKLQGTMEPSSRNICLKVLLKTF